MSLLENNEIMSTDQQQPVSALSNFMSGMYGFLSNLSDHVAPMLTPIKDDLSDTNELFSVWHELTAINTALFRIAETLRDNVVNIGQAKPEDIELLRNYSRTISELFKSPRCPELILAEANLSREIKMKCPHMQPEQIWQLLTTEFKNLTSIDNDRAYQEFVKAFITSNFYIYNRTVTDRIMLDSFQIVRNCRQRLDSKRSRYWRVCEDLFSSPIMTHLFTPASGKETVSEA